MYVFRNARSCAGALGGLDSDVQIHDAPVNGWREVLEMVDWFESDSSRLETVNEHLSGYIPDDIALHTLLGLRNRNQCEKGRKQPKD